MRWFQQQRIEFIDKTIRDAGYINRADIMTEFGISTPQASIDLRTYQQIYPDRIKYNRSRKRYEVAT